MQHKPVKQKQIKIKSMLCMNCRRPTCLQLNGDICLPLSVGKPKKAEDENAAKSVI